MKEIRNRILIQEDWDLALKDQKGKIWIGFKRHGFKTVYGELKRDVNVSEDNGGDHDDDDESDKSTQQRNQASDFSAKLMKNRRIKISYRSPKIDDEDDESNEDDHFSMDVTFKAADNLFQKIHTAQKSVNCLDVTKGGLGVSCDSQGCVKVWLTEDGEVRRTLEGHFGEVYTSKFFPSGLVVLTGGADTQLKIWSAEDGKCAATLKGHQQGVTDTAIIEKGRNLISTSRDGTVKLWDCSQSQCLYTFDWLDSGPINACHLMGAWPNLSLNPPSIPISEKEVLTEGKVVLVATEKHHLIALGLQNRQRIFSYDCSSPANCCTNVTENVITVGCDDSTVHVIDVRKASKALKIFQESRSAILSMLPYKNGSFISTRDGSCYYMDNESFTTSLEFTGPDSIFSMSTDDKHLYTGCRDGRIRKYRISK